MLELEQQKKSTFERKFKQELKGIHWDEGKDR